MPKPTSVATIARIGTDGKKGAGRYAIYYAGGAKVQEVGMSEREIKGTSHYYAVAGARWFGGSCAALGIIEGSVVHERDLERLLRQEDPRTGELLPNNGTKRAKISAFDLTISVPKELSIYYLMAELIPRRPSTRSSKKRTDPHWSTHRPTPARCVEVRMASLL